MRKVDLSKRSDQQEILDEIGLPYQDLCATLKQLARINQLTFAYTSYQNALISFWRKSPKHNEPIRILDIGSGYGDQLRCLYRFCLVRGIRVEMTGIDTNPTVTQIAKEATPHDVPISFVTGNIFDMNSDRQYDIIMNSLMMHHQTNDDIIRFMEWMTQHSTLGWLINDLHRHPIAYHFIRIFTKIFRFHPMIQNDAPISVARGFQTEELNDYIRKANINPSRIKIRWLPNFRYIIRYAHTL